MLAVELVVPCAGRTPDPALTGAVNRACHTAGLITLTCGTFFNVLRFLPPLVMPDALLAEGLEILDEAFATVLSPAPAGALR
jgi:4-aminobutyrate aminotransferase/(S)-3-amino-2-methylpropionate transaminase